MYNSQVCQDNFVDIITNNKKNGYFLDIGAGTGGIRGRYNGFYSNTYYFEHLGWNGIAIDYDIDYINEASSYRKCKLIHADLLDKNINDILRECEAPQIIDYLSFDVDDATMKVLYDIDLSSYQFNIITFEHNYFHYESKPAWSNEKSQKESKILREISREKFISNGYDLLCADVLLNGNNSIEDWYIHKNMFDDRMKKIKCSYKDCKKIIEDSQNLQ